MKPSMTGSCHCCRRVHFRDFTCLPCVALLANFRDDNTEFDSTFEFKSAAPLQEDSFNITMPGCDLVLLKNTFGNHGRETK